ncbi:MAG: ROK family protein [Dehalococcoidales bacterium]|nr:ROK family protein [Dehalococcoidales bacterium]
MPAKNTPVIAVDIGGTKIMAALFSADGKMQAKDTRPTLAGEGVDAVVERLYSAIQDILENNNLVFSQLGAISIACAGGIDTEKGIVVTPSPGLPGWSGLPLADIIKEKTGVITYVLNDASAAALGEQRYGAGKGIKDLVLLTLGTGIGGGIIIDGKLYLGANGGAGELGHMTVEAGGLPCDCGNTGCLEMYASGRAVAADAVERLRKGEKSSLAGNVEKLSAEMVGVAAQKGDKLAREVIERAAFYLGVGMVNIANIFNPQMIVIGGGLAGIGEILIAPGRKMVAERAFSISSRNIKIVGAKLGNEAGVYGAAAFAYDKRRTA